GASLERYPAHPPPPSLPTRRSSDLDGDNPVRHLQRIGVVIGMFALQFAGQRVAAKIIRKCLARFAPRGQLLLALGDQPVCFFALDRKSTRLNSSHVSISYAVFFSSK